MKLSKLLLIEDSPEAADIIKGLLTHAGHDVTHCLTGIEGLETVQKELFDGILLDYMLPDMEGLQLCRMIRESFKEIPIILTTAYIDKVAYKAMIEAGITAFVPKPISQNLLRAISEHVKTQSLSKPGKKSLLGRFFQPYSNEMGNS